MTQAQTQAKQAALSRARLKELLDYDPLTGIFNWKVATGKRVKVGYPAGGINKSHGYVVIRIEGIRYGAHSLAWLHYYGTWPTLEINHIDTDRANNRIANLEDISHRANCAKRRKNIEGHLVGTHFCKDINKWASTIVVNGKKKTLSYHLTQIEAHTAYVDFKALHGLN